MEAVTTPAPALFADVPAWRARASADAPALRFGEAAWTSAELATQVGAAAALAWHGWGVRSGTRVAWLGAGHPAQLVLLFALARIGAALVPLNFRLAPAEWDAQLAQCGPVCIVSDAQWAAQAHALAARAGIPLHPAQAVLDASASEPAPDAASADAPGLLVFTSGTTAGPKAAVHTQANLLANMRIAAQAQAMTPQDRVLTVLPMFHVGGLCIQTLPALLAGAEVVLHPRFDAGETLAAIARERPTLTLQVPPTLQALIVHPDWPTTDLSSLRAVWAGSSLLPAALLEAFHARGVPVCNVYGATETGPFSIALAPAHAMDHVGSCGWPAPGVEVRLANGEVCVRGPNVASRYWPDAPAVDADGWFHSGDLAVQAADGSYAIVGRAKDLIISGGENIHPAELEAVLAEYPGIAECAAFGVPDAQWGEAVAMAVVRAPGALVDEVMLREHLAARLARFKLPRHWLWVDELPKTALGKVQRAALAERFRPQGP